MNLIMRYFVTILILSLCYCGVVFAEEQEQQQSQVKVPVLAYHRFGSTVKDGMTLKTSEFAAQLKWLKDNNYTVIPLKTLVNYLRGEGPPPPAKSVVITADDGHKSVYTDMLPLVKQYNIPVTLFIYPSAISNASYAMTWDQLKTLHDTGLFDIQGHTYWHPNFKKDKKKMSLAEYQKSCDMQFGKSKSVIEKKLGVTVDCLAWPFGIYDNELEQQASKAGYVVAFSIDARCASRTENMMSQPRYMIVNGPGIKGFESIVTHCPQGSVPKES